MTDLTSELNLALCTDNDDTADYLVTAPGLRGSLTTIDGLFNSTTGHNHNGAHQGGNFSSLSLSGGLTVGGNAQITGTLTALGAAHFPSLTVDGAATLGSLAVTGTVTGELHITGAVTADSTLAVTGAATVGSLQSNGFVAAGAAVSVSAGDLSASRGNNTGYAFLANGSHYVGFDGTNYQMPSSLLYVNGDRAVTETAAETLSNKTLNSPVLNSPSIGNPSLSGTVSGQPGWASAQAFPAGTTVGGSRAVATHMPSDWIIDGGSIFFNSIPSGGAGTQIAANFGAAYAAAPWVVCQIRDSSGGINTLQKFGVEARGVGTNGFYAAIDNQTGSTQSLWVDWLAFGH